MDHRDTDDQGTHWLRGKPWEPRPTPTPQQKATT